MKNPTIETFIAAAELAEGGATKAAIQEATGLNYSQLWRYLRSQELEAQGFEFHTTVDPELVAAYRRDTELSWGEIAVRFRTSEAHNLMGAPEGQIRKAWAQATGLKSQGLRIGKGGRFYYEESGRPLYADELRPTGTEIPVGAKLATALAEAEGQKLIRKDISELRSMAEAAGIEVKNAKGKFLTKAQLVRALRPAPVAEEAPVEA